MSDLDRWLEISRDCKYLPENDLKQLCDLVCDLLLEESNIQPVSTPVTVCGDIHGQVGWHMKFITSQRTHQWLASLRHRTHIVTYSEQMHNRRDSTKEKLLNEMRSTHG